MHEGLWVHVLLCGWTGGFFGSEKSMGAGAVASESAGMRGDDGGWKRDERVLGAAGCSLLMAVPHNSSPSS